MSKKLLAYILVLLSFINIVPVYATTNTNQNIATQTETSETSPFYDVSKEDYFYDAVLWADDNDITNGMREGYFEPNTTCTRAHVVTFLWRAAGSPAPKSTLHPFKDVKPSDYFYNAVLWAVEKGITTGTSYNQFSPNSGCTRAQVVTFQYRAALNPEPASANHPFTDISSGQYYYDAVLWAVENNITNGLSENSFGPEATCTRGQIVTFLHRSKDVIDWEALDAYTAPAPEHSYLYIEDVTVDDVILYFNEVCLDSEYSYGGDASLIQKWTGPILYKINGNPTSQDLKVLNNFVQWLNNIYGFPGMYETQDQYQAVLQIHFCSRSELINIMGDNFTNADGAVTYWYEDNAIYNGTICYRNDVNQYLRNSVILEEVYNGLGAVQDTILRPDSIIYQYYSEPQSLTDVDELILKLLYHPDIKCGMNAAQCEAVIRNLYY